MTAATTERDEALAHARHFEADAQSWATMRRSPVFADPVGRRLVEIAIDDGLSLARAWRRRAVELAEEAGR